MIKYEWRTELNPAEVDDLTDVLERAARYDAEPEYTTIQIDDVLHAISRKDPCTHHLLIWMLPYATALDEHDEPEQIAGLLRVVTQQDESAQAAIVIDPRLRSIGITTLLLEQVGLDTSATDGWLGTGAHQITAWAQGNHPAAGRLSNRFLIPSTRRVWQLIRSTAPTRTTSAPTNLGPVTAQDLEGLGWACGFDAARTHALREDGRVAGVATINPDPVASEEFGRCATITGYRIAPDAPASVRRGLLDGAAAVAHAADRSGVIIHVDSDDSDWVNSCRLSGFQHDRTDVLFQLGGQQ